MASDQQWATDARGGTDTRGDSDVGGDSDKQGASDKRGDSDARGNSDTRRASSKSAGTLRKSIWCRVPNDTRKHGDGVAYTRRASDTVSHHRP